MYLLWFFTYFGCRYLRAAQASQSVSSGAAGANVVDESKLTQQDLQDSKATVSRRITSAQLLNILNFLNTSIWACLKIMMP